MNTKQFIAITAQSPLTLAHESLSPLVQPFRYIKTPTLHKSALFRDVVAKIREAQKSALLSQTASPGLMKRAEQANQWVHDLFEKTTGKSIPILEPLLVSAGSPEQQADGMERHSIPFVMVHEQQVSAMKLALNGATWRKRLLNEERINQTRSYPLDGSTSLHGSKAGLATPPFEREKTRQTIEMNFLASLVHELTHAYRGIQLSPSSFDVMRFGLRVDAFRMYQVSRPFLAFTEAAAVLSERRYFLRCGLKPTTYEVTIDDYTDTLQPQWLVWPEFRRLNLRHSGQASTIGGSEQAELLDLLRSIGDLVTDKSDGRTALKILLTEFSDQDRLATTGYETLQVGMELLAIDMFGSKTTDRNHATELLHAQLLRAEALADPREIFRAIKELARRDVDASEHSLGFEEVELGKRYLRFFCAIRPDELFDTFVLQAFAKAGLNLPGREVAKVRSKLTKLFECGRGLTI